jgi:hypothetical protein
MLNLSVAAVALLLTACTPVASSPAVATATTTAGATSPAATGAASVVGTYHCGDGPDSIVELREDGTLIIDILEDPGPPGESTWVVEGDQVLFNAGTPDEDPFTIDGENLVQGAFVCRPAS